MGIRSPARPSTCWGVHVRALPFIQTSVFIDERYAFSGNQLATFWDYMLNARLSPEEMQGITLEMQHSETTFVFESTRSDCVSKVRIFTPGKEIPFAGHPTLGTAFVLRYKRLVSPVDRKVTLELGVGPIAVDFLSEDTVRMAQGRPKFTKTWDDAQSIAKALGLKDSDVSTAYPMQFVSTGMPFLIVPLQSLSAVQRAAPNPTIILETLHGQASQEIVIFSDETVHPDSHVHVRMFAPGAGVPEDPATGSAAGPLGAYLIEHQVLANLRPEQAIVIEQGHEMRRPSRLEVMITGDKSRWEVYVSGKVRLIAEGKLFVRNSAGRA